MIAVSSRTLRWHVAAVGDGVAVVSFRDHGAWFIGRGLETRPPLPDGLPRRAGAAQLPASFPGSGFCILLVMIILAECPIGPTLHS